MRKVEVPLGQRSYQVTIGQDARFELADTVASIGSVSRVGIVTQDSVASTEWFASIDPGVRFEIFTVGEGEPAKSLATVEDLCRKFASYGLGRHDAVVAVGGGVVTDLAGFSASIYLRGVAYVNIATTLLAQVDAAVGGKTGANLPEGKNLVGTFWQPKGVICDLATLETLSAREWACGRGEIAKYAFLVPRGTETFSAGTSIEDQVVRCVEIKADVVSGDERESERRMVLNYGHTLAHALEALDLARHFETRGAGNLGQGILAHGEAVAVGLIFAAILARRMGRIDDGRVDWHRRVVSEFGLSTELPSFARGKGEELVEYMRRDKKANHDLTFVLDGPRGVEPVRGVDIKDVFESIEELESLP